MDQLNALQAALTVVERRFGPMPLAHVIAFLHVALEEGRGVGHYARQTNTHRSVMSRRLQGLDDRLLIEVTGTGRLDGQKEIFLTERGRRLVREMTHLLGCL